MRADGLSAKLPAVQDLKAIGAEQVQPTITIGHRQRGTIRVRCMHAVRDDCLVDGDPFKGFGSADRHPYSFADHNPTGAVRFADDTHTRPFNKAADVPGSPQLLDTQRGWRTASTRTRSALHS